MKELILSVLSLIILLPIIFFLPLGLSNKGKGVIVIASFLLANIGFLTQEVLPLWLLWIVLALLVFLISYVIQGRFGEVIFAGAPSSDQSNDRDNDKKDVLVSQKASTPVKDEEDKSHIAYMPENSEHQEIINDEEELLVFSDEKHPSEDGDDFITSQQSDHEYEVSGITKNKGSLNLDDGEEDELSVLIEQMDTSFLNEREKEWTGVAEAEGAVEDEQKVDDSEESSYMAEIEKLLEEEDEEVVFDDKTEESLEERAEEDVEADLVLEEIPIDDLDFSEHSPDYSAQSPSEEVPEDLSEHLFGATTEFTSEIYDEDERIQTEMLHKEEEIDEFSIHLAPDDEDEEWLDEITDEEKDLEDEQWQITEEENQHPLGIKVEEEYLESFSTQFALDNKEKAINDDQDEIQLNAEPESREEVESSLAALSTSSQSDEDTLQTMKEVATIEQNGTDDTRVFQQQMFSLMASQLQLEGKRLPAEDYEMLIRDHMVDSLSPHDYYTFASMLIEHYIRNKEMGKLHELLCGLREKFAKYPILTMEIQYLYEQYCESTL